LACAVVADHRIYSGRVPNPSAGLLVYRSPGPGGEVLEVLLVHPGGPLWQSKDDGVWSIPKGEIEAGDDPLATAEREFAEELGQPPPAGPRTDLGEVTQRSGKRVQAWAVAGEADVTEVRSNTFEMEWPRRSGQLQTFPEIDRAGWFTPAAARQKLNQAQVAFVDRLVRMVEDLPRRADG
jgi:predicted NUDIX family NTP pyrophosphohydrolase